MKTQRRKNTTTYHGMPQQWSSDYHNGIQNITSIGTLYNWVKRLRKKPVMISPSATGPAIISQPS